HSSAVAVTRDALVLLRRETGKPRYAAARLRVIHGDDSPATRSAASSAARCAITSSSSGGTVTTSGSVTQLPATPSRSVAARTQVPRCPTPRATRAPPPPPRTVPATTLAYAG